MVLENLSQSLRETIRKISGASYIDKDTIKDVSKELQRILLKSDVNVKLVLSLTSTIEKRAAEEKPPPGMVEQDFIVRILYEELLKLLGEDSRLQIRPQKILLVGLYGQGKTTSAGKLARFFIKKGLSVGLTAADVHRPAAYHQLQQIAKQVGAKFYGEEGSGDPVRICRNALDSLQTDVVIIDSSGRDSLSKDLLEEISAIKKVVQPDETLMVIDATMGQQAGPQAETINSAVGITGVIISKMDGTGKGGGALSAISAIKKPVFFIGTGEHMEDMEIFNAKRFLSRMLGLGDLDSLLEVVSDANFTQEEAEKSINKLMTGKFNLKDMYDVWERFSKPGLIGKLFDALPIAKVPGAKKVDMNTLQTAETKLRVYRTIMDSMTYSELEEPEIINASRITRIARGSGKNEQDVRSLLKEFKSMKKNLKELQGNRGFKKMLRSQMKGGNFGLENLEGAMNDEN
ncbi:MAG: signal recognition particle receptor subunit alpha [Candidatus Thermoplasmatota archaeon]|nr:signal recognition particle receptor subunit alpha [Candidatus Thermoplasmatota archaeon]MCL5731580.1 signal recognition particle receptor subunit alpha [Candidatus Thermoplasmatota archaeon]